MIPESVSVKVGAEAVDNILNILASSMLAVTTFSLSIMVTAYGSATTNVTPRATRLVVEDVTTKKCTGHLHRFFSLQSGRDYCPQYGSLWRKGRVILFIVTLVVIALILITLLRWIQHLTSLGRVGETTAKSRTGGDRNIYCESKKSMSQTDIHGLRTMNNQKELLPYIRKIGYVEYIDMVKLGSLLSNDPRHVYLVAQPGSFIHPSMPVLYLSSGQESSICTDLLENDHCLGCAFICSGSPILSQRHGRNSLQGPFARSKRSRYRLMSLAEVFEYSPLTRRIK